MRDHDPRLSVAVIPPSVLLGLIEVARAEGCATQNWFAGSGLTEEILGRPETRVSYRQTAAIVGRALQVLDGPVGLRVGTRDPLFSFGMLGIALRSSETVGDAALAASELHQAAGSLTDVEIERLGPEVGFRLHQRHPDPALVAFEEAFASTLLLARTLLGPDFAPSRLQLGYTVQRDRALAYARFFQCPIEYEADAHRMLLPAGLLDVRLSTYNEANRVLALEACRRQLDEKGPDDLIATLEMMLAERLRRPLTMAQAAERLAITERQLRRRLTDAGTRFSAIRDRVREHRATALLTGSGLPIGAIAEEVGYTDAREFRRAYIRWTGRTPSQARAGIASPPTM
ncbi:AraC family transcriptional regulator ligand-binding domain-containing protein [Streptomyces sp. NPDC001927]